MDKRLRLIVEAVTSQAQLALRNLGLGIRQFGDQAEQKLERVTYKARGFGESLTTLQTMAGMALGYIGSRYVMMAAEAVVSMSQVAAKNLALEESFESVATRYGLVSDKIVEAMQRASKDTIGRFSAMTMASKAMRQGVARDIDDFEKLMKIAYMRARETGRGVEEAWSWIVTGIGGAYPYILKNLNFLVDTNDVLDDHARLLGKTADELSKVQEQEALRNYVLQQGTEDLERWNEVGETAIDVFARQQVEAAELRQELGESFLPTVTGITKALTDMTKELNFAIQAGTSGIPYVTRLWEEFYEQTGDISQAQQLLEKSLAAGTDGVWAQNAALVSWVEVAKLFDRGTREDVKAMRLAERGLGDLGTAADDARVDTEELAKAWDKAGDLWDDYLSDVAERNWQFGRRMEGAQFSMTQAAENAAFRRHEIERNAEQSRQDMLERFGISHEAGLARHYNKLRWMKQDLMDELSDMEWEHERDRSDLMRKSPYWVRNALRKEFQERERIVGTGDAKALKAFDAQLVERIRVIDPALGQELDLLNEHYRHQEEVETREARQGQRRQRTDWRIRDREQRSSLRLQLRTLDRGLSNQLEAWTFHGDQRRERERWSMDRLIQDHDHRLGVLYEKTKHRLDAITPLWEHYGREWGQALLHGMMSGQPYTPLPPGYDPFENWTNPFAGGGPISLAGAGGGGGGGVSIRIENLNLGAGVNVAGARAAATEFSEELGRQMRKRR